MTVVAMLFLVLAGALAQSVAPGWSAMGGAKAPLLLGLVLYYALTREKDVMFLAAVLAGAVEDALSMTPLGYTSTFYCVLGLLVNAFRGLFYAESPVTAGMFGACCGICQAVVLQLLLRREGLVEGAGIPGMARLSGTAVLGLLCTPVLFAVAFGFDRMLGNLGPRRESIDVHYGHP